jgi:hypothetical protein
VIGMVLPSPFLEPRIRSVPALLSTSDNRRLSASEILSPAPYNTRNRAGSTSALFEKEDMGWESIVANKRPLTCGYIGGAEGTRTPDPLVANEVRYQLRHSPMLRTNDNTEECPPRNEPVAAGRDGTDGLPHGSGSATTCP